MFACVHFVLYTLCTAHVMHDYKQLSTIFFQIELAARRQFGKRVNSCL